MESGILGRRRCSEEIQWIFGIFVKRRGRFVLPGYWIMKWRVGRRVIRYNIIMWCLGRTEGKRQLLRSGKWCASMCRTDSKAIIGSISAWSWSVPQCIRYACLAIGTVAEAGGLLRLGGARTVACCRLKGIRAGVRTVVELVGVWCRGDWAKTDMGEWRSCRTRITLITRRLYVSGIARRIRDEKMYLLTFHQPKIEIGFWSRVIRMYYSTD